MYNRKKENVSSQMYQVSLKIFDFVKVEIILES